jgi:hypothetical protein
VQLVSVPVEKRSPWIWVGRAAVSVGSAVVKVGSAPVLVAGSVVEGLQTQVPLCQSAHSFASLWLVVKWGVTRACVVLLEKTTRVWERALGQTSTGRVALLGELVVVLQVASGVKAAVLVGLGALQMVAAASAEGARGGVGVERRRRAMF